ncbi:MAG: MBL fold metallo-hydrolase [Flavobacteriaceae bacterium]|nr:MBL fold metallo-hydrolase [Flavobacteriaceae bacterium]
MKITFLGTGTSQGIPVIGCDHPVCLSENPKDKRLRSSVLIQDEDFQIVIDCGPDFRMQMLQTGIRQLDAIIFTHEHSDHTAGLDDIRQFSHKNGALPLYAEARVLRDLHKRFEYIFNNDIIYEGKPQAKSVQIEAQKTFKIKNKTIVPIAIMHGDLPILGFRIGDFAYLTDISYITSSELEKLNGLKMLVVDALRIEPHYTHFNLAQALDLVETIKPKQTYFTHISHRLGFHDEVEKLLPERVYLSYDGLEVTL